MQGIYSGTEGHGWDAPLPQYCIKYLAYTGCGCLRRRHSLYGVRFWLSQRAIEGAFRRFASYLQGTWFMSLYLRALGAKIGAWVTFRYCNQLIAPDMLDIGEGTHVGDLANIITSCALDASAVLVAPVQIGKQACTRKLCSGCVLHHLHLCKQYLWPPGGLLDKIARPVSVEMSVKGSSYMSRWPQLYAQLMSTNAATQAIFGTTAVIMPGSILGKGALVGAIAATDIGQELAGDTLYMGAPAMATNKHDSGAALCCMTHQDPCEVPQMPCNALSRLPCCRLSALCQASLGRAPG